MNHRAIAVTIALLILFFVGCQRNSSNIAVIKFVTHPALDELEKAFIDQLNSRKVQNTKLASLNIEQYNANGNPQRAKELAEISSRSDVQLIVAIATPSAQAVSRTPSKIPLLYGAVADPKGAGIIPSPRATGIQNAGPNIIQKAVSFIHSFFPTAKRIGSIYNPAEQNSVFVQRLIKQFCDTLGLELVQRTVADPSQLSATTEDLASQVDVIYSANDNTVNAGVTTVVSVCNALRKPFVIGDLSTLSKGPLIAIGLEYRSMGTQLAMIAEEILSGKPISEIPPQGPPEPKVWVNANALRTLALTVPSSLESQVDSLVQNR